MKTFSIEDTNPMSWNEFGEVINLLVTQIQQYFEKKNQKIDAIAPVLRNGAIPGTVIANKLQIIPQLPIQMKYNYDQNKPVQLLPFLKPLISDLGTSPHILITECNTFTGESAKVAAQLVLDQYPNAHLYYATVTRVYRKLPITLPMYEQYFYGQFTDENFEADQETQTRLKIRPKITIFPWETVEFELNDINAALSSG